jgi:hypothetical protein
MSDEQPRYYRFRCIAITCRKPFDFAPTPGQLRALRGGAIVKVVCPNCGGRVHWADPKLEKIEKQEAARAETELRAQVAAGEKESAKA